MLRPLGPLLLIALPCTAAAQASERPDAYVDLVSVLTSPELIAAADAAAIEAARLEFMADPDMSALDAECSGTIDVAVDALRQLVDESGDVGLDEYRASVIAFLRTEMPQEQAVEAAAFYRSEFGGRILQEVGENWSFSEAMQSAMQDEDGKFDRKAVEADSARTARAAGRLVNTPEGFEAALDIGSQEWLRTMLRLQPQLLELKVNYMNADLSPEVNARIEQRMENAILGHVEQCFGELDLGEE